MKIESAEWKALIREGGRQLGIHLEAAVLDQFALHAAELLRWNRRFNLTAITDPAVVAVKHYLDSVVPVERIPPRAALLDLGTGGGFPGIPLKILLPTLQVTLVESSRKKVSFLKHVARVLALERLQILEMRAEAVSPPEAGGGFEVIVSRALTSLAQFFEMALPLASSGALLLAWKGKLSGDEWNEGVRYLQTAAAVPAANIAVRPYALPGLEETRNLVCVNLPQ